MNKEPYYTSISDNIFISGPITEKIKSFINEEYKEKNEFIKKQEQQTKTKVENTLSL